MMSDDSNRRLLEEIRNASDIVDIVSLSVPNLRQVGGTFKALCPFHTEKTPSFTVNRQMQVFHCFGCGAGGDVFKFVMLHDKLDFIAAVRKLAERAGIAFKLDRDGGKGSGERAVLYDIHEKAARLYQEILNTRQEARVARDYIARRQIPAEAVKDFLIGYAPDRWDTVQKWAEGRYAPEQLIAAGLLVRKNDAPDKTYDRFRGRLMFAIHDEQGRVVGFSGRVLGADSEGAKYVNSPETAIFKKSRVLYALHKARTAMVEAREALVCEGQIDVIRCHLNGFSNAVAAQGTAFTQDHARVLRRYVDGVVLVFDSDSAGRKAALRTAHIFLQSELAVRVALMPEGEDPDSFLLARGADAFARIVEQARSVIDFQVDQLQEREDFKNSAGLLRATRELLETIQKSPNAILQAQFIRQAAMRMNLPETAFRTEFEKTARRAGRAQEPPPEKPAAAPAQHASLREEALVELLLRHPELAVPARRFLPLDIIADPACRRLAQIAIQAADRETDTMSAISEQDDEQRTLTSLSARLLAGPEKIGGKIGTPSDSFKALILALRRNAIEARRKAIMDERREHPDMSEADQLRLQTEYASLRYDLDKFKTWETAVPLMNLDAPAQAPPRPGDKPAAPGS